jgi:hypothetical protein
MIKKKVSTYFIDEAIKLRFKVFAARKHTSASKMIEVAMVNLMEPGRLGNKIGPGR